MLPKQNFVFDFQGKHMHQLMDLFAIPEMTLLANVIEVNILTNMSSLLGA
jgi:hypothetical protein